MRRVFVDPEAPQRDALQEAAKWIRAGGVVAIPTDTLYGLAADPFRADAVARVFAVKGREAGRALPLIAVDMAQVVAHLGPMTTLGQRLAEKFWPGPLTLVIQATTALASGVADATGRVGVRVPADRVAREICRAADRPLTATSANRSGAPATADPDEVERALGADLDLLVDAGTTRGGAASTIVDVSDAAPRLVRAGATSWDDIQTWLNGFAPLTEPAA